MPFTAKKLQHSRIFQDVVAQIEQAILEGSLSPGEQLPSEMQLKGMFDTSRGTVREALRVLEQKGLIDIRLGASGGAFVREPDTDKVVESLDLLVQLRKVSMDDLTEFRAVVEGAVAELAAQRAGGQGATGLRPLLERASACLAQEPADWRVFLEVDVALHIAVAELSGNPMFVAVLQVVHERILAGSDRFATRERPRLQAMFDDLSAMVGAIEAGRAGEARERAVAHVREYGRQFGRPGLSPGRLSGNTE